MINFRRLRMSVEEWRVCADFPNYEISSAGCVRRTTAVRGKNPQILKPWDDHGYCAFKLRRNGKTIKAYMHRLLGKAYHGLNDDTEIDHRNHVTTDNSDIRVASRAQNCRNTRGWRNRSSNFKGVSWNASRRKWYACIAIDGKTKSLGTYTSEVEAARAYDKAAFSAWGEFAFLNFKEAAK